MCGITIFVDSSHFISPETFRATIKHMPDSIHRRGLDNSGAWTDLESDLALDFWGHSNAQVMLIFIYRWGIQNAVRRFNGGFVFVQWNHRERQLIQTRNRLGSKLFPLWVGT